MIGVDTSFLVALAAREHADHERCQALFEEEILGRPASMCLAAQVLAEFTHVITDERRFENPLRVSDALDPCEQWWHAEECRPATRGRRGRSPLPGLDAGVPTGSRTVARHATFGVFDLVVL